MKRTHQQKIINTGQLCHEICQKSLKSASTCPGLPSRNLCNILKRKSFATLPKMLVPFFGPKQSLSDNAIDKSLYLPCIQHKNQNGAAYGCRATTIILRQPPILKSHGYNTSHVMRKIFFKPISVFKSRMKDKFKSG